MRLYSFVNFYLSSIQQGIQTGHLSVDMVMKYGTQGCNELIQRNICEDWARNHKTYITLNGGANADIISTYDTLSEICPELKLPFCNFHEDELSLGGIMTCCGVVVPEKYYGAINARTFVEKYLDDRLIYNSSYFYINEDESFNEYELNSPEWKLINLIKSCSLAR
jgi:hypothetical protein